MRKLLTANSLHLALKFDAQSQAAYKQALWAMSGMAGTLGGTLQDSAGQIRVTMGVDSQTAVIELKFHPIDDDLFGKVGRGLVIELGRLVRAVRIDDNRRTIWLQCQPEHICYHSRWTEQAVELMLRGQAFSIERVDARLERLRPLPIQRSFKAEGILV